MLCNLHCSHDILLASDTFCGHLCPSRAQTCPAAVVVSMRSTGHHGELSRGLQSILVGKTTSHPSHPGHVVTQPCLQKAWVSMIRSMTRPMPSNDGSSCSRTWAPSHISGLRKKAAAEEEEESLQEKEGGRRGGQTAEKEEEVATAEEAS